MNGPTGRSPEHPTSTHHSMRRVDPGQSTPQLIRSTGGPMADRFVGQWFEPGGDPNRATL